MNNLSADSRGATEKFPFAERAKTLVPDDDHGGEREGERERDREREDKPGKESSQPARSRRCEKMEISGDTHKEVNG